MKAFFKYLIAVIQMILFNIKDRAGIYFLITVLHSILHPVNIFAEWFQKRQLFGRTELVAGTGCSSRQSAGRPQGKKSQIPGSLYFVLIIFYCIVQTSSITCSDFRE